MGPEITSGQALTTNEATPAPRITTPQQAQQQQAQQSGQQQAPQFHQHLNNSQQSTASSSSAAQPQQPQQMSSGVDGRPIRPPQRQAPPLPTAYQHEYTRPAPSRAPTRVMSPTGGLQVTLDGGGSWSELARQDATLPSDANAAAGADGKGGESGGMFGFLKSKKGRNHSPRPKERGVLGKEGARVVIG